MPEGTCSIPTCREPSRVRGWCRAHYWRWQRHGDPLGGGTPRPRGRSIRERIIVKIRMTDGHWLWQAAIDKPSGYGIITIDGVVKKAHRVSYEEFVGPIPEGLHIDHVCRVRACVNPLHLEPVTCLENVRRGQGNGSQTHCKHGHLFDEANTYVYQGRRVCRTCRRIRVRDFYRRNKARS